MNRTIRLIIQSGLWLIIGNIIWLNQDANIEILKENLVVLMFQILLISALIYFAAPKLLFEKKHLLFAVFSILLIGLFVWVLSHIFHAPLEEVQPAIRPEMRPHPTPEMRPRPLEMKKPPTHYLLYSLILSITYVLALSIEVYSYLKQKEKETIKALNVNLQNELKLLKSQINPHFLFNSLNNIYTLAGIDSNKTQKSIIHLSDMLRYVLYECDQETVPLKKEIEYIENYLKLFTLKSSKTYPISTEFTISNHAATIAPMLLIPFIENALKHSNIDDINNAFIKIKIEADEKSLNFEVENSKPQKIIIKDKVGGIGLENVKKRLAILYPKKHQLIVSDNETFFKVKLQLKLT
ncbi:histidine kinase [Seonamhaeicola sp. NFXS20]|uniref:sensor histidine kinase n=1 Tax=Seonamhaeicola sp. NFXS20 TaxID=2816959 RepID=UPI003B8B0697